MKKQIHGGDIYRHPNVTDFSVNTNPLGTPEAVLKVLQEKSENIAYYPDMECEELRESISKYEQISTEKILCGNGAAELFYAAVLAVKPKKALLLAPTFSEYAKALKTVDADICYYVLSKEKDYEVQEDLLNALTPTLDMVFFCNPNNPTGIVTKPELLRKLILKCEAYKIVCVVDECFLDFLEDEADYEIKSMCETCRYLVIVKAFTKIFCMPGLRLGYALSGNLELLEKMCSMMQAWNVSVPAQLGGIAALESPEDYLKKTRDYIKEERTWMIQMLIQMGYKVYASRANYVFFEGPLGLYEKALAAGFLIRDCQGYVGLEAGTYRLAVRTHEENERILKWLRQL